MSNIQYSIPTSSQMPTYSPERSILGQDAANYVIILDAVHALNGEKGILGSDLILQKQVITTHTTSTTEKITEIRGMPPLIHVSQVKQQEKRTSYCDITKANSEQSLQERKIQHIILSEYLKQIKGNYPRKSVEETNKVSLDLKNLNFEPELRRDEEYISLDYFEKYYCRNKSADHNAMLMENIANKSNKKDVQVTYIQGEKRIYEEEENKSCKKKKQGTPSRVVDAGSELFTSVTNKKDTVSYKIHKANGNELDSSNKNTFSNIKEKLNCYDMNILRNYLSNVHKKANQVEANHCESCDEKTSSPDETNNKIMDKDKDQHKDRNECSVAINLDDHSSDENDVIIIETDATRKEKAHMDLASKLIEPMAENINLRRKIVNIAKDLFNKVHYHASLKTIVKRTIASACLYIACRQTGYPRTFKEICDSFNIRIRNIARCYKLILNVLDLNMGIITISDYMLRLCSNLDLSWTVQELATHIAKRAVELHISTGFNSLSAAASAVYLASQALDEKRTFQEIADVTRLTEPTIRKTVRLMYPYICSLFPIGFIFRSPIQKPRGEQEMEKALALAMTENETSQNETVKVCDVLTNEKKITNMKPEIASKTVLKCNICSKWFISSYFHEKHLQTHRGMKKYRCEVCGIFFRNKGPYQWHLFIHEQKNSSLKSL